MKYTDQIGRHITLSETPIRIVSLVPSQTELLHDLGLENAVVGITKFCIHPIHYKNNKTIIGGTKQINIEKIKALKPDIILCNKEENTKDIVEACQAICATHVSDIVTIEHCLELINQYGLMFNKEVGAANISKKIRLNLKDFQNFIKDKPILKAAYFIWRAPWMVAGKGTFIDYLLRLNRFKNVYGNLDRYPIIELEQLNLDNTLEVVLLSSEPYPFKKEHALEINNASNFAKAIFVDGEMFSWYGSRLIKAFSYFKMLRRNL